MEDQLNDLTELHQHETSDLKQELASIEEKVAYQAYERARDIQVRTDTLELEQQSGIYIYMTFLTRHIFINCKLNVFQDTFISIS